MTYCGLKSVFEMPTGRQSSRTNQIQDPQVCWHSIYELCSMSCDWAHKYLVVPQRM